MPLEADLTDGERWSFDADVAGSFDDMLARSIPQYDVMRSTVADLGARFAPGPGSTVVDLGCSRGQALAPFAAAGCDVVGLEVSEPMLAAARERFAGQENVVVRSWDLRAGYPPVAADLTLSVLTLQFVPIEHRQRVLRDAWRSTRPGGALVLVEKVLGATADVDRAMVDLYYDGKRRAGYSDDEIDRKRLSLEGVLVPVTARWNEELLAGAGFAEVDCFWRWMNFAGWLAVRESR